MNHPVSLNTTLKLRKFALYVFLATALALPGVGMRLTGTHWTPLLDTFMFGVANLGAGFLLSWGAEAAEEHVSRGLAIAALALVTVLPEYAIDVYYTFQAGQHPGSEYVQFAAANMTGANRLLIGMAWPLIVLLYWWRSGKRAVELSWTNTPEVSYLGLATLYSFIITFKGRIDFFDMVALIGIFFAYLWRVAKLPREKDDDDNDGKEEVGPAAVLAQLPKGRQYTIMAALTLVAALVILTVAEPFAESLIEAGSSLGINKFLLIQWIGPLASEAPEIIICVLFVLSFKPTVALGALISDKINQWTLLVGLMPAVYSAGAVHLRALPLDARQLEEFFLTAAQSLFALSLILRLRFSLSSAVVLLGLFLTQLALDFAFHDNEARTIVVLTMMSWLYIALALVLLFYNRLGLVRYVGVGLLNRPQRIPLRR